MISCGGWLELFFVYSSVLVGFLYGSCMPLFRLHVISKKLTTFDIYIYNELKFGRFYLLPKIHKRLHSVPGRPIISNSGFYTENISALLDFHLKPIVTKVKLYIKDTNDFL